MPREDHPEDREATPLGQANVTSRQSMQNKG